MSLTGDILEYISDYPYTRIENLEVFFDEFTKTQLLQAVRSLAARDKIIWKRSTIIIKTMGADEVEYGWVVNDKR